MIVPVDEGLIVRNIESFYSFYNVPNFRHKEFITCINIGKLFEYTKAAWMSVETFPEGPSQCKSNVKTCAMVIAAYFT